MWQDGPPLPGEQQCRSVAQQATHHWLRPVAPPAGPHLQASRRKVPEQQQHQGGRRKREEPPQFPARDVHRGQGRPHPLARHPRVARPPLHRGAMACAVASAAARGSILRASDGARGCAASSVTRSSAPLLSPCPGTSTGGLQGGASAHGRKGRGVFVLLCLRPLPIYVHVV